MVETTELKDDEIVIEIEEEVAVEKPYTFRRLFSPDIFPMFKIIGKIGLKEFTAAIDGDVLRKLIDEFIAENKESEDEETTERRSGWSALAVSGTTVMLGVADVIISRLPSCENDIYQILSQTSNLTVDEVKALDAVVFFEMVVDFVTKEEFKDFIKVVSRLFK